MKCFFLFLRLLLLCLRQSVMSHRTPISRLFKKKKKKTTPVNLLLSRCCVFPGEEKKHQNHGLDLKKEKEKKHRRDLLVVLKFISFVSRDVIVIKYYIS